MHVFVVWNCRKVIGVNCKTTKLKLSAKWKWINRERIKQFSTDINWTGKRRKFQKQRASLKNQVNFVNIDETRLNGLFSP